MKLGERIVAALTASDGMTRGELVEALGLSANAVGPAVAALLESGRVENAPRDHGGEPAAPGGPVRRGRPTTVLRVPGPAGMVVTVTASVTEPWVGVTTMSGRLLISEPVKLATGTAAAGSDDPAEPLAGIVRAALGHAARSAPGPVRHLVLAVPAPFRLGIAEPFARTVGFGPSYDTPVRDDPSVALQAQLGIPVAADNDANLAALGELDAGAGRGHQDLIYVSLDGHSLGAGLILDGRLHRGASGFGGEFAHLHVDDLGVPCACGSHGCLTGRLGLPLIDAVQAAWGIPVTWNSLLSRAQHDDLRAQRVLHDLGRLIGRPLADVVTILNPTAVILDGRLGAAADHILAGVGDQINRYTAPAAAATVTVLPGQLPDAVAVGGTRLMRENALNTLRTTHPAPRYP